MAQKITKALLETLAVPPGGREFLVFDTEVTGYAVKVTVAGAKRFLLQYSRVGKTKRLTLGKWGDVTEADARKQAKIAVGILANGGDPVALREAEQAARKAAAAERQRVAEADAFTVDELVRSWAATKLKSASARYQKDGPHGVRRLLAEHLHKPARSLTRAQAQKAVDDMAKRAPVGANRLRAYARAAFAWAAKRALIETDPFKAVQTEVKERSRERVLKDAEIGEVWRAAGRLAHPWGGYVRVLLLTLQRRTEVAGMAWRELSDDLATWTLPGARVKNRQAHIVHITEPARAILRAVPRGGRYVFTARGKKTPINSYGKLRLMLNEKIMEERAKAPAAEFPALDWSWHDFRRTGVTMLAKSGVSVHVADKILNHVAGTISGVMATYQRHNFEEERKAALEAWAAYVLRQAEGGKEGENSVGESDAIPAAAEAH